MKRIDFSDHALEQMTARGASASDAEQVIRAGEPVPAKQGRLAFRKNFPFEDVWKNRYYETRQVLVIAVEEAERFVVVTVFVFYFGGSDEDKLRS